MLFSELLDKEIFCIVDGRRIGYLDDFEIDPKLFHLKALISHGKTKFWGLFGREEDLYIPVEQICVIGEDSILVNQEFVISKHQEKKQAFLRQFFE